MTDLKGAFPESWCCIDCGVDTAPGCLNRKQAEQVFAIGRADQKVSVTVDKRAELYRVKSGVWARAGIGERDGCLCIGCLEKRIGRQLKPEDFPRKHPFNRLPGTARLLARRGG